MYNPININISLQTRTKFKKTFKGILNCCQPQIDLKSQKKLANFFDSKIAYLSTYCVEWYINITLEYAIRPITVTLIDTDTYRHLKAKPAEHTGILLSTLEKLNHGKRV